VASLRDDQVRRYARHVLLPDVGGTGQRRLLDATARFAELSPAAGVALVYLAAAGVGTIVVDDEAPVGEGDVGALFEAADVGRSRREAAAARAAALNPDATVVASGAGRAVVVDDAEEPLLAGARAARRWIAEAVAA
jgi:adenylyltransferase/sulfurtransferase